MSAGYVNVATTGYLPDQAVYKLVIIARAP